MVQWKRVDAWHDLPHLTQDHEVYVAREYKIRGGYVGETNQLILNFKKAGSERSTSEWQYRNQAVARFAAEISDWLNGTPCSFIAIPTSKAKTDVEYTNRFEDLFDLLATQLPLAQFEWPLALTSNVQPAHDGGQRDPNTIAKQYTWQGLKNQDPKIIIVVDDVLTTGSHFRAVHDCLRFNIIGICWARALR